MLLRFLNSIIISTVLALCHSGTSYAALAATTIWEENASASANMVNGGGFNTANANFATDLTTDTNTANTSAPVVSSATYNFVAADAGAKFFVKTGTNFYANTFCPISSVASNKATLDASIGACETYDTATGRWKPNTVVGIASVGTPTGGTWGVDFSRQTASEATDTGASTTGAGSTSLDSITLPFRFSMQGNLVHIVSGTNATAGWYECVQFTNTASIVLDRSATPAGVGATILFHLGGALGLNSTLDDDWSEIPVAGNLVFAKAGSYTLGESVSVGSTSAVANTPIFYIGYQTVRGDNPTSAANWPIITTSNQTYVAGQFQNFERFSFTGTSAAIFTTGTSTFNRFIKSTCTSTSASRVGFGAGASSVNIGVEGVSQFGVGIQLTNNDSRVFASYAHDCGTHGIQTFSSRQQIIGSIAVACQVSGLNVTSSGNAVTLLNNTVRGYSTPRATGILITSGASPTSLVNNIVTQWTTGIAGTTTQQFQNIGMYNSYYGNTTDVSLYTKDFTDITGTNPTFANVTELSGSTATTSGSVITQSGGDFSTVTDNVDYIQLHSGSGIAVGTYLITSHTSTTVTVNVAPGTNITTDKVWTILTGKNFAIGTPLKAAGYPGAFPAGFTTGYTDPGAAQRQETGASGSTGFFIY